MLLLVCLLAACGTGESGDDQRQSSEPSGTHTASGNATEGETASEQPAEETFDGSFNNPKEVSRSGNYKTMEMYVRGNEENISRRITFEVPVAWNGDGSVMGITDENNVTIMKVEMLAAGSATRESVFSDYDQNIASLTASGVEVADRGDYTTERYEVFYFKFQGIDQESSLQASVYIYYLYANEECFAFGGHVFIEDGPEYDAIFKRIAESVRFQF